MDISCFIKVFLRFVNSKYYFNLDLILGVMDYKYNGTYFCN